MKMMTMITSMRKPVGMLDRDNFANHDPSKIKKDPATMRTLLRVTAKNFIS